MLQQKMFPFKIHVFPKDQSLSFEPACLNIPWIAGLKSSNFVLNTVK